MIDIGSHELWRDRVCSRDTLVRIWLICVSQAPRCGRYVKASQAPITRAVTDRALICPRLRPWLRYLGHSEGHSWLAYGLPVDHLAMTLASAMP